VADVALSSVMLLPMIANVNSSGLSDFAAKLYTNEKLRYDCVLVDAQK